MRPYMICTDTGADIFWRTVQQQRIEIAHLRYTLNDNDFIYDLGRSMDLSAFYYAMQNGGEVSTISAQPETFCALWRPALHTGLDILYMGISGKLGKTFSAAAEAREQMLSQYNDRRIVLVDTHSCSVAQGMLVFEAAQMRHEGKEMFDVADWAVENRAYIHGLLLQPDTTWLRSSGFYSGPRRKTALLRLDADGSVQTEEKCKSTEEAMDALVAYVAKMGYALKSQVIGIVHAEAQELAADIGERLVRDTDCERTALLKMGPIVGSKAGPGAVAVSFFGNKRN